MIKSLKALGMLLLTVLLAQNAVSQTLSLTDEAGFPGGAPVSVTLSFTEGTAIEATSFTVTYDGVALGPVDLTNCGGSGVPSAGVTTTCFSGSAGTITFDVFSSTPGNSIQTGSLGTLGFSIPGSTPPSPTPFPLAFSDVVFADGSGGAVSGTANDGSITVNAPAGGFYTSTPAPGSQLNLGEAVVGTPATPVDTLLVENLSADPFDVTGFPTPPAELTFPATPVTVPGNGSFDFSGANAITCTPSTVGVNSGTFDVSHDAAGGATTPVNYGFTCTGLAPNVQVAPTSLTLNGAIGGTPPTASFDVSNPDNGTASDAQNASVADTGVSTEVSISDGLTDSVISVTETDSVTVSCSTAAPGTFNETITVAWDDPVGGGQATQDVTVTCNIANIAPGYTSVPTPGSTLAFGQVVNGQTSAAQTINIGNENSVGTGTQAELQITGAVLSDPTSFSFTPSSAFPITLPEMAPNGTASIDVTCGPDSVGALTETLTVNTNDGDQVYDLTCEGTSNAGLVATPNVIDGSFNLGSVPPNTTASNSITFSNSGTDPLNLTCTLTNNNAGIITSTALPSGTAIPPDFTITFDGTPPDINTFQETLDCDVDDPTTMASPDQTFTVDVAVSGRPLVIPTLSQWGLLLMMLSLLVAGGFAARRMTA